MKIALTCVLVLTGTVAYLQAQATTVSQISGIVQDSSGAAIGGAQVTVTNTDTDAARSAVTGSDGAYAITNLVVGPYRLQVTKDGFSTYNQSGIVLQVNTNPQINVVLKIGAVSEQVEVQANAGMVETQNTSVGQVIDQRRVVDLPLNGRNVTQLITLSGGAVSAVNPNASGTTASTGGIVNNLNYPTVAAFSVAGGQGNATNYLLDGGSHMDSRSNVGLPLPFPDALQEFKVETSSLPANYGSHPGGVVNAAFHNMARAVCRVAYSGGVGEGGFILTQRFALQCEKRQDVVARLSKSVLPPLADLHGVAGVHLCIADESVSTVETFEKTFRAAEDLTPPYVLMIEGTSCAYVEAAGDVVAKALAPAFADSAVYQLEHALANFGCNGFVPRL